MSIIEKAAGGASNTHGGYQIQQQSHIISHQEMTQSPALGVFNRTQAKFAVHGRQLMRSHNLRKPHDSYVVKHRGELRHFPAWADVVAHLAQIGGGL